jgi:hypothetical protein
LIHPKSGPQFFTVFGAKLVIVDINGNPKIVAYGLPNALFVPGFTAKIKHLRRYLETQVYIFKNRETLENLVKNAKNFPADTHKSCQKMAKKGQTQPN